MTVKLVLITYPGTFNYGNFSVAQSIESFLEIEDSYTDLPVQIGHTDGAPVGKILRAVISPNGYTYAVLSLPDGLTQKGVSLGYHLEVTRDESGVLLSNGKIAPFHLALTDNPRKTSCIFDNLPTTSQLQTLIQMETTFLDLLNLFIKSAGVLEDMTDVTPNGILQVANESVSPADVFMGEVKTYLQANGIEPVEDPMEVMTQLTSLHADSAAVNAYIPGMLQKRLKDALTEPIKVVRCPSSAHRTNNKSVILK